MAGGLLWWLKPEHHSGPAQVASTMEQHAPVSVPAEATNPAPTLTVIPRPPTAIGSGAPVRNAAPPAKPADQERMRGLAAALRTAKARLETLRRMTPDQRAALTALEQRYGGRVEVRLRPETGTPRFLELPAGGAANAPARAANAEPVVAARDFLSANRALLRLLEPAREVRLLHSETDRHGQTHLRLAQTYQGLDVWPAQLLVHLNAATEVTLLDGAFVPTPREVPVVPQLDPRQALAAARQAVPGGATAEAGPLELIVHGPGDQPARLAWRIEVDAAPDSRWLVVIDAANGSTLARLSRVRDNGFLGSGVDLWNKPQTLNVWQQASTYYLVDTSKPMFDSASSPPLKAKGALAVWDAQHQSGDSGATMTLHQVSSASPISGWLKDGVSAAFTLSQVYDYYRERHARNSIDGQGGTVNGVVRYGDSYPNAFWNGQALFFGDGQAYAGTLDIVGHEWTHGVTDNTASLIYQDQPGALNEAFSDILGEAVEDRARGRHDWLVGADLGLPFRCFTNPGSIQFLSGHPYPSSMSQFIGPNDPILARFTDHDNGGVHLNSGIINRAFYLLSEGLTGAVGLPNAANIFYRALTVHLVPQSQFLDCRLACVAAARELFGQSSPQAAATAAAFDEVGIFDGAGSSAPPAHPVVSGADSVVFVYQDAALHGKYLGRWEDVADDKYDDIRLSSYPVAAARPSVSGDGEMAAFVDASNDMALIATDGYEDEYPLGYAGQVSAVAMAPDGNHYGFVMLDEQGKPENKILMVDTSPTGSSETIYLTAPSDAGAVATIFHANTMAFSQDNRYLVYDAFNALRLSDGSTNGVWSIYAYDLLAGRCLTLVAPKPGVDISHPAFGHLGNDLLAFEAVSQLTGYSTVQTANWRTGELRTVATINSRRAMPCYNGDDSFLVFAKPDLSTRTGTSLVRQPLAPDHLSPTGSTSVWETDAGWGVVYRRGTYTPPAAEQNADLRLTASTSTNLVLPQAALTLIATVLNRGPDPATGITLTDTLPTNTTLVSSVASQGTVTQQGGKLTVQLGTLALNSQATLTLVVRAAANGISRNTLSVVADQTDPNPADNNASTSLTVEGDITPPTLAITSHTDLQDLYAAVITLAGTASDAGGGDHGIASVTVNGMPANHGTATGAVTTVWSCVVRLNPGLNTLTVVASDRQANATTNVIRLLAAAPTVVITEPAAKAVLAGPLITVRGTADSHWPPTSIWWQTNDGPWLTAVGTSNWTVAVTVAPGTNWFRVLSRDNLGNPSLTNELRLTSEAPDGTNFLVLTSATLQFGLFPPYNLVSVPFADAVLTNAESLARALPNCSGVWKWDALAQGWSGHRPGGPNNFVVQAGQSLMVSVTNPGNFLLTGCWSTAPQPLRPGYNLVLLSLAHQDLPTVEALTRGLTNCTGAWKWDAAVQGWSGHRAGGPNNFAVELGRPYLVYLTSDACW